MNRLSILFLSLAIASCDTSMKTTDGTSSETQTSLQALADNVRKVPAIPSASSTGGTPGIAGRRQASDACPEYHQTERYWPDTLWGRGTGYAWHVARNRIVACTSDSSVLSGYEGFRRVEDSTSWQVVSEITIHADGSRVFRSSFESDLGGGFRMRSRQVEYQTSSGGPDGDHPWQMLERVLTDDHVAVDLLALELLNPPSPRDSTFSRDTLEYRSPILDLTRGRLKIGYFFHLRGGRIEVRNLDGVLVAPNIPARRVQSDSMGLRLIENAGDADSFRLSLRLQTLEPTGFASAATALALTDSSGVGELFVDSLPEGALILHLGTGGSASGRRIEWSAPRNAAQDRVCLLRRYPKENGQWDWQVAAVLTFDGRVVEP